MNSVSFLGDTYSDDCRFLSRPAGDDDPLRHPLAVLVSCMDWVGIDEGLAPLFARTMRVGREVEDRYLFGPALQVASAGGGEVGRPRLPSVDDVAAVYEARLQREGRVYRPTLG